MKVITNAGIADALRNDDIDPELVRVAPDGVVVVDLGEGLESLCLGFSDPEDEDDPAQGQDWVDWTVYGPDGAIQEQDGGTLGQAVTRARHFAEA